jgi:hypothetical protein
VLIDDAGESLSLTILMAAAAFHGRTVVRSPRPVSEADHILPSRGGTSNIESELV